MGHYDIVIFLMGLEDQRIDVNSKNLAGRTALHKASFGGHHSICLLLLENGADPRVNDNALGKPIDYAQNKKTKKILKHWDYERTKAFWEKSKDKKPIKLFYEYLELDNEEKEKVRY